MTENAKKLRNAYHKKWRDANKDKIRANNERYWERKAAAAECDLQDQDGGSND